MEPPKIIPLPNMRKAAVLQLMESITGALDAVEAGEMTVAEAIGCLEMAKLNLFYDSMKSED